jgi:Arylsulfotransferase (ASST)
VEKTLMNILPVVIWKETQTALIYKCQTVRLGVKKLHLLAAGLAAVAAVTGSWIREAYAMPTVFPTGVTIDDKDAAYPCDVLYSIGGKTYLIDMAGKVVKQWNFNAEPAKMLPPSLWGGQKGVIGLRLVDVPGSQMPHLAGIGLVPGEVAPRVNKTFGFIDWNGKVLWQWSGPSSVGAALQNHDWDRLPNGNTLIFSGVMRSLPAFGDRKIVDDVMYEVNPAGSIVWQWSATDHLNEFGFTPAELKLVEYSASPDYLHVNDMEVIGPNHWAAAGNTRFTPGNIIFSSRNANFTAIIDRKTGHIVWRIGPDYPPLQEEQPGKLPRPIDQISGQHDPNMIADGLPGAGNILIFDNQGDAGFPGVERALLGGSRMLEINPVTKQIVWEYVASMSGQQDFDFFSPFIGSAERLPNGNTLIDEGINGRFFQITPNGKIVWEYVTPLPDDKEQSNAPGAPAVQMNRVYRAQAIPLDWIPSPSNAAE